MTNLVIFFRGTKLFSTFLAFLRKLWSGFSLQVLTKNTIFYKPKRAAVGRFFGSRKLVFFCSGLFASIPNAMQFNYVIQLKFIPEI
jgi:hypothetical protein